MIPTRAYPVRFGLVVAVTTSSLAWGAIASTPTGAAPPTAAQPSFASLQPRSAATFDDTFAFLNRSLLVKDDSPTTQPNPATIAVDFGDDTVYVANAWSGTVEVLSPGQTSGPTAPRVTVNTIVPVAPPPSFPSGATGNIGLYGIAVNSPDDTVYVVNRSQSPRSTYIWAINGRTMTVDDTGVLADCSGDNPSGAYTPAYHTIAVDNVTDTVYVPCPGPSGRARVVAVNGSSLSVDDSYTTSGSYTYSGVAVTSSGKVLVSGWDGSAGAVTVFGSGLNVDTTWTTPFSQPAAIAVGDDTAYVSSYSTTSLWGRNINSSATMSVTLDASTTGWQALAYRGGSTPMLFVGSQALSGTPGIKAVNLQSGSATLISGVATSSIAVTSRDLVYGGNDYSTQYIYKAVQVIAKVPNVPAAPTGTAGDGQVSLTWVAPASGIPITNYKVVASPGGAQCSPSPSTSTSCTVTGLTAGTAYTFRLQAQSAAGWSSASAASSPVTPTALPGAPTGVSAVAGVQQATVTWSPPGSSGYPSTVTNYEVTSSPASTGCSTTGSPAGVTCTVTGLIAGTPYTFSVKASNSGGSTWGPVSAASASVTPTAPPPVPVANMQLTMSSSPARFEKAGDVLTITATILNNGTDTLNAVRLDQGRIPLVCTPQTPVATLTLGNSVVCRGTYTVTEEDVDASVVTDRVTARATAELTGSPLTASALLTVQGPPPPERLQLRVTMNSSPPSFSRVGEKLLLTALVTNTGNVAVTDVVITGAPVDMTCVPNSPVRSLAVKGSMRCSGNYQVTKADMSAGVLRSLTRATGVSTRGTRIASTGAVEVPRTSPERASVKVTLSSTPDTFRRAGQTLTLTATALNKGDVPLTNVTVVGAPGRFTCEPRTPVATLEVDATVTCTASYAVTAADVRSGVIRATAKASGVTAKGTATSDDVAIRIKEASPPRTRSLFTRMLSLHFW